MLSVLKPSCIHKELAGYETTRVYDYEENFQNNMINHAFHEDIVRWNSYYDWEYECKVYFFDYIDKNKPLYRYYLFYQTASKSFHTPITEEQANASTLPVEEIGTLLTQGDAIQDLTSVQFVDKLIELIKSGKFQYVGGSAIPVSAKTQEEHKEANKKELVSCYKPWQFWNMIFDDIREDVLQKINQKELVPTEYVLSDIEKQELDNTANQRFTNLSKHRNVKCWNCYYKNKAKLQSQ